MAFEIDANLPDRLQLYLLSPNVKLYEGKAFSWPLPFKRMPDIGSVEEESEGSGRIELAPSGNSRFSLEDQYVQVGGTGVKVKVGDLHLSEPETGIIMNAKRYSMPSFVERGSATIIGTDMADDITVRQNADGNTIVDVRSGGRVYSLNIGSIAAVTIDAGTGNDTVQISGENYFGGVTISGGSGKDDISADVSMAMERGVTITGDGGDDKIVVRGNASRLDIAGGDDDDAIDTRDAAWDGLLQVVRGGAGVDQLLAGEKQAVYGEAGADLIIAGTGDNEIDGGEGNDVLYGGAGNDRIRGGAGDDIIRGGDGADILMGDAGNDLLLGEGGGDWLIGGIGDDALYGGSSMDEITRRTDTGGIETGGTYNFLVGGAGADIFAPSSTAPWNTAEYSESGSSLLDLEDGVDVLA